MPTQCSHCTQAQRNLRSAKQAQWKLTEHSRMRMTAKTLIAHAHTLLTRQKSCRKIFRSESFRDEKRFKNSSHQRLSVTTKRRKGALFMVHSAWTLTVPLRLSGSHFCFVMRDFLSRELKISFDAQAGAMPLLGHRTFSLFPRPCGLSFLRAQGRALCLLHRHCIDRLAQRHPALSALQLVHLFMLLKTNL